MSELLLYRAHKKVHPPTNLQYDYAKGHAVVLGGGRSHEQGSVGTQARTSPPRNDAGAIEEGRYKATWESEYNTSLTRKRNPLGPYRRRMPRVFGGS